MTLHYRQKHWKHKQSYRYTVYQDEKCIKNADISVYVINHMHIN